MNIIISNYTSRKKDSANVFDDKTILNITIKSPLAPSEVFPKQNLDKIDMPTGDQNISEFTSSKESTLNIIKMSSNIKYDEVKKCCNQLNVINLSKTDSCQEHNMVNISSKIAESCSDVESNNNPQLLLETNHLEPNISDTAEVNIATKLKLNFQTESVTFYNSQDTKYVLKNDSNKYKKPKKRVKKSHMGNRSPIDKSVDIEVNEKGVKFKKTSKVLTETEKQMKSKSEDENSTNTHTSKQHNLHKNTFPTKPRTKKVSNKNTKVVKTKGANTSNDKKSKRIAVKSKINKLKNSMIGDASPKELRLNSNNFNVKASDDLSWFDSIKYVREIDEQEYFRPTQLLDDKFWCNQTLPLINAKDFNI